MRDRPKWVSTMARKHVADWLKYCHRRSGRRPRLNGRIMICTGCAYDAVANAIEEAVQRERARRDKK